MYAYTARLHEARREFERVLTISQSVGDIFHQSFALGVTGFLKNWEGDYGEALRLQSEGLRLARKHNVLYRSCEVSSVTELPSPGKATMTRLSNIRRGISNLREGG